MLGHAPLAGSPLASAGGQTLSAVGTAAGSTTVDGVLVALAEAAGASTGVSTTSGALASTAASTGSAAGLATPSASIGATVDITGSAAGSAAGEAAAVAGLRFDGSAEGASDLVGDTGAIGFDGVVEASSDMVGDLWAVFTAFTAGSAAGAGGFTGYTLPNGVLSIGAHKRGGPVSSRAVSAISVSSAIYIGENELTLFAVEDLDALSVRLLNSSWDDDTPAVADEWDTAAVPVIDWSAVDQASTEVWEKRD